MKRRVLMIGALGFFFLFAQIALADWSAEKQLTWTAGDSLYPAIATDSKNGIHVVWNDNTPGHFEVYYKKSADGGATWTRC
jgi:hypothetical protein